jgi:hypothetical protein
VCFFFFFNKNLKEKLIDIYFFSLFIYKKELLVSFKKSLKIKWDNSDYIIIF